MSEPAAKLVHEFTYNMTCSAPNDVGPGPFGHRQYYELTSGNVDGPRLRGSLLGTGSDWMLHGPDGFLRMDVRMQIVTDDGAVICIHYFGPAEANAQLMKGITECAPTNFVDQSIRSHWLLETGDERYSWVNQAIFVAEGRLRPAGSGQLGFEHRVYRVG